MLEVWKVNVPLRILEDPMLKALKDNPRVNMYHGCTLFFSPLPHSCWWNNIFHVCGVGYLHLWSGVVLLFSNLCLPVTVVSVFIYPCQKRLQSRTTKVIWGVLQQNQTKWTSRWLWLSLV